MREYEMLPEGLKGWCCQVAAQTAGNDSQAMVAEYGAVAYRTYTQLCAEHEPEVAEKIALEKLGSPVEAYYLGQIKTAKVLLIAATVVLLIAALGDIFGVLGFALLQQSEASRWFYHYLEPSGFGLLSLFGAVFFAVTMAYYLRTEKKVFDAIG